MNAEQQLKLMAWVDGELPDTEARQMAEYVQAEKAAQALTDELRMCKSMLAGNEPSPTLAESREFYWSKIQREIERQEKIAPQPGQFSWLASWRRVLAPVSGLALIAFVSVFSFNLLRTPTLEDTMKELVEVENLSEDIGTISYKSQSENMFVVYVYNKEQPVPDFESDPEAEPKDDTSIQ